MSFRTGDRVYVDPATPGAARNVLGRVWIVKRVNPVNVVCSPEDGVGRGINYPRTSLVALAPGESVPAGRPVIETVDIPAYFVGGEAVATDWPKGRDKVWIVNRDNGDTVSCLPLGGDGGRYARLPKSGITRLSLADVAERLVAAL
jgi:hypothetical protein